MAIEHADFEGTERLAAVLGAEITSTFDRPDLAKLGTCDLIDEIMIGEDKLIRFSGCASGEACTVVLRGASTHVLDEAERSLHDALCVLSRTVRETRTIPGGGCCETRMARAIDSEVPNTPGKKALAMDKGDVADMTELGIRESFKSKLHVLVSAAEAAEMILRVDDIVKCAPRKREGQ